MPKFTRFIGSMAIGCLLALPAIAQEVTSDTVVATVNGTDITIGHMIVLRNNLPQQYQNLDDKVLYDGILDQVVQQTVLSQTMDTLSMAIALQLENERRALLAGAAMADMLAESITDDVVQAAYEKQYTQADPVKEYNAAHILVETEEEALALIVKLDEGAEFGALAAEFSTGPSGPSGGSLGWFGPGMMVQPFEEAVETMQDGDVSAPVQTQFGWHVIILNETRFQSAPALDDVRAELVDELQQKAVADIIEKLSGEADISRADLPDLDPAILRDTSLVQN